MGIIDRLGDVIKSYLNDEEEAVFKRSSQSRYSKDPDLEAAFEELDDYLAGGSGKEKNTAFRAEDFAGRFYTQTGSGQSRSYTGHFESRETPIPDCIQQDFAELGLPVGASPEECKGAYKKLLKIHHPDRHAGHPGNMKKATEKSSRINAAYDRIERWRQTGKVD